MRISTPLLYQQGVDAMGRAQSDLLRTQQQISANKRMLTPADDPVAAAQALATRQSQAENDRFSANIAAAKDALGLGDSVLAQITDVLQRVRTTAINAGNAGLNDADRRSLAVDVSAQLDQLVGLANSRDGNGNFLYSGFQSATQPFANTGTTIVYNGDQGQRQLQVSPTRTLDLGSNGSALFEQVRNGNGTFTVTPAAGNAGSGVIGAATVTDATALTGDRYRLQFSVAAGVTTYNVQDVTTGSTLSSGNAYTDGASITVAGMQVKLSGAPATGDTFDLAPSSAQSIFSTLQQLVTTLQSPGGSTAANARNANGVNAALQNVDQALEHVLAARADGGAKLRELDALASGNSDRGLQFQQTLSRLEDLDYNKALSHFSQQQVALQAAQKSFLQLSGLSLFNYL